MLGWVGGTVGWVKGVGGEVGGVRERWEGGGVRGWGRDTLFRVSYWGHSSCQDKTRRHSVGILIC